MDAFVEIYGLDYLMGMFGQSWELEYLQGSGDLGEGISNSIWPVEESGKYVMLVRAYDLNGDITDRRFEFDIEVGGDVVAGPSITIFSKTKGDGTVSVNFEIAPSNVEEAYVRLCGENFVDDRLNMGYELHELAMGGDAEDITSAINTLGEYTFSATDIDAEWKSLLIYAMDKDGHRTTLRINFYPDTMTGWSIDDPVYKTPARKLPVIKHVRNKRNPTMPRL
ncbi:MAG: hypothetical protein Q4C34_06645 [Bacteroidales bacterium]|nr:hypothetical protein [Bacteroidales bacterium]